MENRYKKVVYKDTSGKVFELYKPPNKTLFICDGECGELIIKAVEEEYSENYINPPIPKGYRYVLGKWDEGFVIEREYDHSQFTWVPVGYLDSDGTMYGMSYWEKFGTRKIVGAEDGSLYFELINEEYIDQLESVRKFGGFYISSYAISEGDDGEVHSLKGEKPLTSVPGEDAYEKALEFEKNFGVRSHLPLGAEYDCIIAWLQKSKDVTFSDVVIDSKDWGNYDTFELQPTGSYEQWCNKKIYDFFGNVEEFTQEYYCDPDGDTYNFVTRGGSAFEENPAVCRSRITNIEEGDFDVGFRIALCIMPNAEVTYLDNNS